MIAMLRAAIARMPGGVIPESYLVLDIETSGFSVNAGAVMTQFGYAVVRDRKIVDHNAITILRPHGTMLDKHGQQSQASKVTGITDDVIQATGIEPARIYPELIAFMLDMRAQGMYIAGHNFIGFDWKFIQDDFEREGFPHEFVPAELCLDSGVLFKASQAGLEPGDDESFIDFLVRAKNANFRGLKWNLTDCAEYFQLEQQPDVDMTNIHDAGFDCFLTHYLIETLRRLAEAPVPSAPMPAPSPPIEM